jgi:phage tail sheath protein FI
VTAPGIQILERVALPSPTAPTDTGVLFLVSPTAQGPSAPRLVQTLDQAFGANGIYGPGRGVFGAYDALDIFFREGGSSAYLARVTGTGATAATRTLVDAGAANTLTITANGPGTWGNSLTVAVVAGVASGTYALQIALSGVVVEQSVDLTTVGDAVQWASQSSNYITAAQVGTTAGVPAVVGASALSGGNDGSAITDTNYVTAIGLFPDTLGPGQIAAPGRTSSTVQLALLAHAAANNRYALIDLTDSSSPSTLASATAALAGANARYGMAFAPWIQVQGIATGTTRLVPPSAVAAGLLARTDGLLGPGTPAAGEQGQSATAIGLSQNFTVASDRDTLNTAGVNIFRSMFGGIRLYGFRSLANPSSQQPYLQASQDRYLMGLRARLAAAAEAFAFQKIDGAGHIFTKLQGALNSVLLDDYNADELYGDTPQDAFAVDVSNKVNTSDTVARGEIHAVCAVRVSPYAEHVIIEIAKIPVTQTLPAAA